MSYRHAIILVKGQGSDYLIGTRADNKKITFPAGGIDDGEDPRVGAERELMEETGFKAKNMTLKACFKRVNKEGKHMILYVFESEIEGSPTLENDPDQEFRSLYWKDPMSIPEKDLHILLEDNVALKVIQINRLSV